MSLPQRPPATEQPDAPIAPDTRTRSELPSDVRAGLPARTDATGALRGPAGASVDPGRSPGDGDAALDTDTRTRWQRFVGSPLCNGVTLVLTLWAGVYANKHTNEISDAVQFWRDRYTDDPFAVHAAWFAALGVAITLLTLAAQSATNRQQEQTERRRRDAEQKLIRATAEITALTTTADSERRSAEQRLLGATQHLAQADARREAAERRLVETTERIVGLATTMPPETFLRSFADADVAGLRAVLDATLAALSDEGIDAEGAAEAVRTILFGIAKLVMTFEGGGAEYGANVMLWLPAEALDESSAEGQEIVDALHFAGPRRDLRDVDGVLVLRTDLAVRTVEGGSGVPDDLPPMSLRVPHDPSPVVGGMTRYRVVPSAALAFVLQEPALFHDAGHVVRWAETNGDYDPGVIDELRAYGARAGNRVHGFLCVPLPGPVDGDLPFIGVLNVHSDRGEFLAHRDPAQHLYPLLFPLLVQLREALDLLSEAETSPPERAEAAARERAEAPGEEDTPAEDLESWFGEAGPGADESGSGESPSQGQA